MINLVASPRYGDIYVPAGKSSAASGERRLHQDEIAEEEPASPRAPVFSLAAFGSKAESGSCLAPQGLRPTAKLLPNVSGRTCFI